MIEIIIPLILGVISLTLLVMVLYGFRSLMHGRVSLMTAGAIAIPMILLVVLGFVLQDWPRAAVLTILITLVGALLATVLSSLKGLFG